MVCYQVICPLEVQMVVVVILVLDHDIVLHECCQDPRLPPRHLWRGLRRGGRGQSLRGVEGDLGVRPVIHRVAGVEMILRLENIKQVHLNINI